MPILGATVAIIDDGRILLTKREDFEVWCLPGGGVEAGESVAQAAVREAREETGLEVELTRLVGLYSRPFMNHGGSHIILFAARPIGGMLRPAPHEVLKAAYFDRSSLPDPILHGDRQKILDALDGVGGSVAWSQHMTWPFEQGITREELYAMRDRSGLSRQQFYLQHFGQSEPHDDRLEAGGPSLDHKR